LGKPSCWPTPGIDKYWGVFAPSPRMTVQDVLSRPDAGPPPGPATGPAFELLESKLSPPRVREETVSRAPLIILLEEHSGSAPIAVLSAGPGWGKTTLLAQWASRSPRPFAWVSIDEEDNDPIVLLTYVAAALDRVSPLDPAVFDALASPGVSVEGTVVPRLGRALASRDNEVVLVLDDMHLLRDRQGLDAIGTLGRHVPPGSQLALSVRGDPPIPSAALRARGLALRIGPDDLRLSGEDAGRLLRAVGVDLQDAELAELVDHAEGWPAGVYLAALSIRAQGGWSKGGATFVGSDRLVADYLRAELLEHLAPDEVRLLTRTAVLERMSGPLCDAVLESSGSAAVLESLERSNLFLVPLDRDRQWYRYHHLFQELLRAELEHSDPDLVPLLLARACEWCVANGQAEAAMGYAQEAGDVDRAAKLFEQCGPLVYQSGRIATTERWLGWLEAHGAMERNAAVAALGAAVASTWGRPAEAERLADAAERASYEGSLPDGSDSVESWLAIVRAQLCRRGVAQMRKDAEFSVRTLARGSFNRPNAALQLAFSQWLAGEVDQADDLFADVAEEGVELGAHEAAALALGERAAIALGAGAWVQAEETVERALRLIRRSRMEDYPTSAFVWALAARVALRRDGAERAQEFLARAQRLRPRLTYAVPYFSVQTRLELARAYMALADAGGAATMLREIEPILRRRPDLGVLPAEVEELRASLTMMRAEAPGASTLTEAELRLLPYLATHLTFREIGDRLYLSRHTIKSQAMANYRKLNVTSRSAAVERARELGLL
jgi:LuxR family transcriptional regulator, maltose regulon positive regulatory protein